MEIGKKFYEMDEESQQLKNYAEKELIELVKTKDFESLLEIGCGDGHFLKDFLDKKVLGLDINESMLNEAKGNLRKRLKNINIVENKSFLEENLGKYGVITSNYVFTELKKEELTKIFESIISC